MTQVNATIAGRQFRLACEDGQEDHLTRLAKDLDQRIEQLKGSFGAIGDMRLIVMAALTVGDELSEAAKRVRDAGFRRWDVFSPFPIHGMDEAMGLGKSWLSAVVLIGGVTGLLTAVILEFGPSWFIYPVIVHGKPFNWATVPAFFPIMFELTILFSAFSAFFANLIMNGLPRWHHPIFNWDRFARVTNDGFFLAIEARDPRFSEMETHDLLVETGGLHITVVHEED